MAEPTQVASLFCCPECSHSLTFSESRMLWCSACGEQATGAGSWLDFLETGWSPPGLDRQRKIWDLRATWYERTLPVTKLLSSGSFSYHAVVAAMAREALQNASDGPILDVATGTGLVARHLAALDPGRTIVALDFSPEMLVRAESVASRLNLDTVQFVRADAHQMPLADDSFAAVLCAAALNNMQDPQQVVNEMLRVLRPGGVLYLLLTMKTAKSVRVQLAQRLLTLAYRTSKINLRWLGHDEMRDMLHQAGAGEVAVRTLSGSWAVACGRRPLHAAS